MHILTFLHLLWPGVPSIPSPSLSTNTYEMVKQCQGTICLLLMLPGLTQHYSACWEKKVKNVSKTQGHMKEDKSVYLPISHELVTLCWVLLSGLNVIGLAVNAEQLLISMASSLCSLFCQILVWGDTSFSLSRLIAAFMLFTASPTFLCVYSFLVC